MQDLDIRRDIIAHCRMMNANGLNQGTAGNISVRVGNAMLITPTSIPYDIMQPEEIAVLPFDGEYGAYQGPRPPSSEWRFHFDIMRSRPDVHSIVHAHPLYSTSLAIARRPIPACHYMIAAFGGTDVRVAEYATYGTKELSINALKALEGRSACLLANHGAIATGRSLADAMWRAIELENIAHQYINALQIGGPVILTDAQIEEVGRKGFASTYGSHGQGQ